MTPKCTLNPRTSKKNSFDACWGVYLTFPFASWGHVNPIGPRACYDEGKRVAETLTYGFHRQDGVDVRVARIFNTFGPRMNVRINLPRLFDDAADVTSSYSPTMAVLSPTSSSRLSRARTSPSMVMASRLAPSNTSMTSSTVSSTS